MKIEEGRWQGHQDLNPGPADLESAEATEDRAKATVESTSVNARECGATGDNGVSGDLGDSQTEVLWRPIPSTSGRYEASSTGHVRNAKTGRVLKQGANRNGYSEVNVPRDGRWVTARVHRLVMEAFEGASDLQVDHIDGDKSNNRLDNLRYVTAAENMRHESPRRREAARERFRAEMAETLRQIRADLEAKHGKGRS